MEQESPAPLVDRRRSIEHLFLERRHQGTGHVRVLCTTCSTIVYECLCQDVEKVMTQVVCRKCGPQSPQQLKLVERRHCVSRRKASRRASDA
jgi:hypothetical protein